MKIGWPPLQVGPTKASAHLRHLYEGGAGFTPDSALSWIGNNPYAYYVAANGSEEWQHGPRLTAPARFAGIARGHWYGLTRLTRSHNVATSRPRRGVPSSPSILAGPPSWHPL
jgi:hypothetical protein